MKLLLLVFSLVFLCVCENTAAAHCWIGPKAELSLGKLQKRQLLAYRKRNSLISREVELALSKSGYKPSAQATSVVVPPVPPPPDTAKEGLVDPNVYSSLDSCAALYGLVTDMYNSALCHVKATVESDNVSKQVECLAGYPGSPEEVKKLSDGIKIVTSEDPAYEAFGLMVDKLKTFLGEKYVCDGATTHEEFVERYRALLQSEHRFRREIAEVQKRY